MEEELSLSMMEWESRLGGGPHDTARQLGAAPDQDPADPHSLQQQEVSSQNQPDLFIVLCFGNLND